MNASNLSTSKRRRQLRQRLVIAMLLLFILGTGMVPFIDSTPGHEIVFGLLAKNRYVRESIRPVVKMAGREPQFDRQLALAKSRQHARSGIDYLSIRRK